MSFEKEETMQQIEAEISDRGSSEKSSQIEGDQQIETIDQTGAVEGYRGSEERENDCGWDESETLADRIRKLGEKEERIRSTSPRGGRSQNLQGGTADLDRGDFKQDSLVTEQQSNRPNIWKTLEKMQTRARGGGSGPGMHRGPRDPVAPRFTRPTEAFQDNRRGFVPANVGPRFSAARDRNFDHRGGKGGRNRDGGYRDYAFDSGSTKSNEEAYDDGSMTKGIGGEDARSFHQEARLSKDSHAYRSLQVTLRGGGPSQDRTVSAASSVSSRGSRGSVRHGGGGRQQGKTGYSEWQHDDREKGYSEWQHDDRGNSDKDYESKTGHRYSHTRQARGREEYLDEDCGSKPTDKRNAYWLLDADDADVVSNYNRSRAAASRESPTLDSLRNAFENLDHSSHSSKQVQSMLLKLADDYCDDNSDRWLKIIDQFVMAYAAERGGTYADLACTFFGRCIDRALFQKAVYISLMRHISNLMAPHEWTEKDHIEAQNLCDMFGRLLVLVWPPGWDSCAKECNMIIYAIMNAVQTWLQALDKATSRGSTVRENIAEVSSICLWHLATATGRKLWLKWPDLIDQMYATLRSVIVSRSCPVQEDTKLKLLDLYVKLNEWPKPAGQQSKVKRDAIVQTEHTEAPSQRTWTPQGSAFDAVSPTYGPAQVQGLPLAQFSVPPPSLSFSQANYGPSAMMQHQQQQRPVNFHGSFQPTRQSFIGPMGKQ